MRLRGSALRPATFIGEDDRYGHHPLYHEIVQRAFQSGLAGATY
jgi:hypothetical protein